MKKLTVSVVFLAFALIFVPSCSKKSTPPQEPKTITLKPANNPDEIHLFGNSTVDESDPNAPEIMGAAGTTGGGTVAIRAALKFDLSAIPKNATVISAKLTLFSNPTPINGQGGTANSGSNNALVLQRITEDWNAESTSWNLQPSGTTEDELLIPHTNTEYQDLNNLDVTAQVSKMVNNEANYGFLLRLKNEQPYNFRIFCSSKYANAAKHPTLEVTYK